MLLTSPAVLHTSSNVSHPQRHVHAAHGLSYFTATLRRGTTPDISAVRRSPQGCVIHCWRGLVTPTSLSHHICLPGQCATVGEVVGHQQGGQCPCRALTLPSVAVFILGQRYHLTVLMMLSPDWDSKTNVCSRTFYILHILKII